MKIDIEVDNISIENIIAAQVKAQAMNNGFTINYKAGNVFLLTWELPIKKPVEFLGLIDEIVMANSMDILDKCECGDIEDVRYSDADNMCGIRDSIHTSNENNNGDYNVR